MEATKTDLNHPPLRVLILKFSSIGDIFQALAAVDALRASWSPLILDWAVRGDLAGILEGAQAEGLIQTIYAHSRHGGARDLLNLAQHLSQRRYTHIYDAHGSIRSRFLCIYLRFATLRSGNQKLKILRRPKQRIRRFLKLTLGLKRIFKCNILPYPWDAEKSYVKPLLAWGIHERPTLERVENDQNQKPSTAPYGVIVPGSAWEMKNWPVSHWKELICLLDRSITPVLHWIILGGEKDLICKVLSDELEKETLTQLKIENYAGKTSLRQAMEVIEKSSIVVGVDTGWVHWSNRTGVPTLSIQGPSAFGGIFAPNSRNIMTAGPLYCQPCSKDGSGKCRNQVYQKCLSDIKPEQVLAEIKKFF